MAEFSQSEFERVIRSSLQDLMAAYDDQYWTDIRETNRFPTEVWDDLAEGGWLGIAIPEEYGGQGYGIQELIAVVDELGKNGGWPMCLNYVISPIFGGETLTAHGSEAQKEEWLPKIANGDALWSLGVTEPDAGLNTTNISTTARKDGDEYVINGRKMWTSGVNDAERITLLARTLPPEEAEKPSHGLSLFLVDPDDPNVDYDLIPLDGYFPDETFNLYLDDVRVPETAILGEEHEGLHHLFDTLNTERIAVSATAVATGRYALKKAVDYAGDREVFDAPIGSHQAIQHPLAQAYADLETADLMIQKAARLYDTGGDAGPAANIANLQAGLAAYDACEAAMTTFGGMSIGKEMGISAMWSFVRHLRITPISEEMLLNYLGEHVLELPKSY